MHEWHLTQELLDVVCSQATDNGISKVTRLRIDLGKDSHMTEESLRFCFEVLSKETLAAEAELNLTPSEGRALTLLSLEGEGRGRDRG